MYRLTTFGTTSLPGYDYEWDAGTAETVQALVRTVGGPAFDAYGAGDAPASMPYTLRYECVTIGATQAALRTQMDGLRALRGKRLALTRQAEDDDSEHWAWARLMEIKARNTVANQAMIWQPLSLVFQVMSPWYGAAHDHSFTLDASPKGCALDNDGNIAATDITLTVTAGSAAITALTLTIGTSCNWTYDGTIAIGEALVVDSGAFSALNDGDDAYADFELGAGHAVLEWIRLEPGETTVTLAITGGDVDSTARFEYYDAWA